MQWVTTTHILEDLKNSNSTAAWEEFCKHLRPVVINFAKHLGLSDNDAEDAAQDTMLTFVKALREGKYDREKGHLSHWLFGIAKRVILNKRGQKPLEQLIADRTTRTSFWDLVKDDYSLTRTWETQWQQMVLKRCLEQAQQEFDDKVFKAFELYAFSEVSAEEVAQKLQMSRNAVYIAKCRVLSRLRQLKKEFEQSD